MIESDQPGPPSLARTAPEVPSRNGRKYLLIGAAAAIAGAGALFLVNPAESGVYPFCLFNRATGLLCPGCGGLRATHQLLHGNVAAAFHLNPLFVLALPLFAWFGLRLAVRSWQGEPVLVPVRSRWLWGALIVLLAFGVLRNLLLPPMI